MIYAILIVHFGIICGHFLYGMRQYLPKTETLDEETKQTSYAVFHYMSVVYIVIAIYLLAVVFESMAVSIEAIHFIGYFYIGCGVVNFYYGTKVGLNKMFQWILFFILGILMVLY